MNDEQRKVVRRYEETLAEDQKSIFLKLTQEQKLTEVKNWALLKYERSCDKLEATMEIYKRDLRKVQGLIDEYWQRYELINKIEGIVLEAFLSMSLGIAFVLHYQRSGQYVQLIAMLSKWTMWHGEKAKKALQLQTTLTELDALEE